MFGEAQDGPSGLTDSPGAAPVALLTQAKQGFAVLPAHQTPSRSSDTPFFYLDRQRTFFVSSYTDLGTAPEADFVLPRFTPPFGSFGRMDTGGHADLIGSVETAYYGGNASVPVVLDRKQVKPRKSEVRLKSRRSSKPEPVSWSPVIVGSTSPTLAAPQSELTADLGLGSWSVPFLGVLLTKRYRFHNFYHPHAALMIRQLNRYGVAGLLAPDPDAHGLDGADLLRQQVRSDDFASYGPTSVVDQSYERRPKRDFDFSFGGAYSQYNWELFFHAPLLIAERLMQNQRFEEAQKWFHYIFDPTEVAGTAPRRFWKIKPFYSFTDETSMEALLSLLERGDDDVEAQVEAWEADPFDPHVIARQRTVAYMRAVVMKYIENLIAWGDNLFRRDTLESINEATQIYVLAAQILGRRPERIRTSQPSAHTFVELLRTELDALSNTRVAVESRLPWLTYHRSGPSTGASAILERSTSAFRRMTSCSAIGTRSPIGYSRYAIA